MNGWFEEWAGYAFDEPSGSWPEAKYGAELDLRRLLWARLMSQIDKRGSDPYYPSYRDRSALWRLRTCGRGAGFARACENGHDYFTPLGCGSPWCLRCQGMNADLRAMRVHRDLRDLSEIAGAWGKRPPVVRIQLTLSPRDREAVVRGEREGANSMIRHARTAITQAAGSDGSMPLMVTMHPTSSKRPWFKAPHIHATALWTDINESGTNPLPWAESGPVALDALRDAWGSSYPSSTVIRASYHRHDPERDQHVRHDGLTLGRALRYDLRPFQEDVWMAVAERRMGVPGGKMWELMDPWREGEVRAEGMTDGKEAVRALEGHGGVLLWPRMHRVRRYGALASRGYSSRVKAMRRSAMVNERDESHMCPCPDCGERLECVKTDEGRVLLLRPWEACDYRLKSGWGKARCPEVMA